MDKPMSLVLRSEEKRLFQIPKREKDKGMDSNLKFAAAAAIGLIFSLINFAGSAPDTTISTVLCNTGSYSGGDPFAVSLAYILQELETATPARESYDFYNISPYPNALAYGHASCNQNITASDCTICLGSAETDMMNTCRSRIGGRAVLVDCQIRYEQYPFTD